MAGREVMVGGNVTVYVWLWSYNLFSYTVPKYTIIYYNFAPNYQTSFSEKGIMNIYQNCTGHQLSFHHINTHLVRIGNCTLYSSFLELHYVLWIMNNIFSNLSSLCFTSETKDVIPKTKRKQYVDMKNIFFQSGFSFFRNKGTVG